PLCFSGKGQLFSYDSHSQNSTDSILLNLNHPEDLEGEVERIQGLAGQTTSMLTEALLNLAEKNEGAMKWKDVYNLTIDGIEEFDYYPGMRGMSSVGMTYAELYSSTGNATYYSILQSIGDFVLALAVNGTVGKTWPKSEANSRNWTIARYGNAGILPFLLEIGKITKAQRFIDGAKAAADYLVETKINNGTGVAYWLTNGRNGFVATDFYYGVAGVISSLLDAYVTLNKSVYLSTAIEGGNWLISLAEKPEITTDQAFVPWTVSNDEVFRTLAHTGYLSGQAGIGEVFLKLHAIDRGSNWLEFAKKLGNWLRGTDFNDTGLYPSAGAPYLTNRDENSGNILGLASGSLGIARFFLHLYDKDREEQWLYEIIRI
ncbi:MAG TPA: lanthionine synthetase LanC family protein, partial [Candidatus Hodarchaeales archaeon]|nr:lanthionine synthetase LanC family protein [Candidatus Hodarchaeales archaeon]